MPTARTVASAANADEAIVALVEYSGSGRLPLEDRSQTGAVAINHPKIKPASDGTAHIATALAYRAGELTAYTLGRVEMWRGDRRFGLSVAAPFVWRCPSTRAVIPFPHPAHRTGLADRPHPALGQNITPSPTTDHGPVVSDGRARSTRTSARVDKSRPVCA